jgi:iron(III) transport system substrate-binding protein
VGIIKGTKRKEAASRLVDFLTSEQAELALARSKSRQIPLGPVDAKQIPDEVRRLVEWSKDAVDLRNLLPARRECLEWLKQEYVR